MAPRPDSGPQARYTYLHRTLDSGRADDRTWSELTRVCLELGHHQEAIEACARIRKPAYRRHWQEELFRLGLCERPSRSRPDLVAVDPRESFGEQVLDAFRYVLQDHLPATIAVATGTFPLVMGLGGLLARGTPFLLFPLVALLPMLAVLALVGALSRRVLLDAIDGIEDAPPIPQGRKLASEAMRFLGDGVVLCVIFLAPGALLLAAGLPPMAGAGALLLGAFLLPMALLLRQSRRDWSALQPRQLGGAVLESGLPYLGTVAVGLLLFAPAVVICWATVGTPIYLQLAIAGPLTILPLLLGMRLLGTTTGRALARRMTRQGERPACAPRPAPAGLARRPAPRPVPRQPSSRAITRPVSEPHAHPRRHAQASGVRSHRGVTAPARGADHPRPGVAAARRAPEPARTFQRPPAPCGVTGVPLPHFSS